MSILTWLAGLAAAVLLLGALLPRRVKVERTMLVAAGPEALFPLLASFRSGWSRWSPFGPQRDPTAQMMFSGADHGVGAVQQWTSQHLGQGQMILTAADPVQGVAYELQLGKRFKSGGRIDLSPAPAGTRVNWSTSVDLGPNPLMHYLGFLVRSGMGQAFDEGLAALRREAEKPRGTA